MIYHVKKTLWRFVMDTQKEYKRVKEIKEAFVQDQYECPVCKGELDIFVEQVDSFEVEEEARCPHCAKLLRIEGHTVH